MRGASGAEPRRHAPGASPGGYGTSVAAMSSNTLAHADIATVCRARHRTTARPGARKPFPRSCCSRPFSLSRRGFRATFCEETHRPRRATTYDAPGSRAGAPRASPTPQDGCVHQRRDCFPFCDPRMCVLRSSHRRLLLSHQNSAPRLPPSLRLAGGIQHPSDHPLQPCPLSHGVFWGSP